MSSEEEEDEDEELLEDEASGFASGGAVDILEAEALNKLQVEVRGCATFDKVLSNSTRTASLSLAASSCKRPAYFLLVLELALCARAAFVPFQSPIKSHSSSPSCWKRAAVGKNLRRVL